MQGFLAHVVKKNLFAAAAPEHGKLRVFLLAAFRNFIADMDTRERAQKRGGGVEILQIETIGIGLHPGIEPVETRTPEQLFDRNWAWATLQAALAALELQKEKKGRIKRFKILKPFLLDENTGETNQAAEQDLGLTGDALHQAVHRSAAGSQMVNSRVGYPPSRCP